MSADGQRIVAPKPPDYGALHGWYPYADAVARRRRERARGAAPEWWLCRALTAGRASAPAVDLTLRDVFAARWNMNSPRLIFALTSATLRQSRAPTAPSHERRRGFVGARVVGFGNRGGYNVGTPSTANQVRKRHLHVAFSIADDTRSHRRKIDSLGPPGIFRARRQAAASLRRNVVVRHHRSRRVAGNLVARQRSCCTTASTSTTGYPQ